MYLRTNACGRNDVIYFPCRTKPTFEKVNLSVSAPNKSGVNIVRDTGKALAYVFWISVVHRGVSVLPILCAFEKVSFTVFIRKRGVNVARQAGPRARNGLGKSLSQSVVRQLPVVIACKYRGARGFVIFFYNNIRVQNNGLGILDMALTFKHKSFTGGRIEQSVHFSVCT